MILRSAFMIYSVAAILAAIALTVHITGTFPVETVNHCPQSETFVCPSNRINPVPMAVNLGLGLGLLLPGMVAVSLLQRNKGDSA